MCQCAGAVKFLLSISIYTVMDRKVSPLECIGLGLPLSTNLHSDLHASIDFFRASLIIDTELENIAILELKGARFDAGVGESRMVEERA